jgi:uncharacterized GH25 family protein
MKIHTLLATLVAAGATLPLFAHDFWMLPSSFTPEKGSLLSVTLRVGDYAVGDDVPRAEERIADFAMRGVGLDKKIVGRDGGNPAGYVRVESEGLFVLGYRSNHAFVELEAAKFESYLHENGLDSALALRTARGENTVRGREMYSRCCKTMIKVGKSDGSGFDSMLGYTLELLPEKNPFDLETVDKGQGETALEPVPLRLFYEGKPLADTLVAALDLDRAQPKQDEPRQEPITVRTDADGRAQIELPHGGRWLFAAVHMIHVDGNDKADWESFWASLTVEIPRADARKKT